MGTLDFDKMEEMTEKELPEEQRNRMKSNSYSLDEVVDINGSKVFVENGEVKVKLNEDIERTGYMTVEESREITLAAVRKIYELNGGLFD